MLDSDLARLHDVETKRVNEAVGRNPYRFPERFSFKLTSDEAESVRSQIATLQSGQGKQKEWWRHPPRVLERLASE